MIFSCHHNSILSPPFHFILSLFLMRMKSFQQISFWSLTKKNYDKIKAKFPSYFLLMELNIYPFNSQRHLYGVLKRNFSFSTKFNEILYLLFSRQHCSALYILQICDHIRIVIELYINHWRNSLVLLHKYKKYGF